MLTSGEKALREGGVEVQPHGVAHFWARLLPTFVSPACVSSRCGGMFAFLLFAIRVASNIDIYIEYNISNIYNIE